MQIAGNHRLRTMIRKPQSNGNEKPEVPDKTITRFMTLPIQVMNRWSSDVINAKPTNCYFKMAIQFGYLCELAHPV